MPVSLTDHTDATTMLWSAVQANLDAIRTYINSVPAADVDDASVQREHLVRPVIRGFPIHGMYGDWQELYTTPGVGMHEAERMATDEWASRVEKLIIRPQEHNGSTGFDDIDKVIFLPIGKPLELDRARTAEVSITFEYHHDVVLAAINPEYPDGAAGLANASIAGSFYIAVYDRSNDTVTLIRESEQVAYPVVNAAAPTAHHDYFHLYAAIALSAGRYDVMLAYDVTSVSSTIVSTWQVEIGRVQPSFEVY